MISKNAYRAGLRFAAAVLGSAALFWSGASHAESVLRIAMTAADIPYTAGQPDQGYEGNRFTGITLYDSLIQFDLSKANAPSGLIPDLATSWSVSSTDKTKWIFKLRPGVKFHDGSPFNADAVVWNVRKIADKSAPQFDPRQAGLTISRMPTLVSARKIDDLTVELTTSIPDSFFPYNATNLYFASPTQWQKDYDAVPASVTDPAKRSQLAWATFAAHPSGTGPFKGVLLVPHQRFEMVRNPDYWDPARRPKIDRVVLLPMPEASARTAALLGHQVDWIEAPAPDAISQIKRAGFTIYANTQPHLWPWQLSLAPGSPWRDLRVRQAANMCIDRDGMKTLLGGYMTPALGVYSPGDPWWGNPTYHIRYDPAAARQLMTAAGYSAAKPMEVKVQISSAGSGQMQPEEMNEFMQENLKQCFFDVKLEVLDWNTLLSNWRLGALDPAAHGANAINVSASTMDPFFGMVRFSSKGAFPPVSNNWGYFSDATTEKLVQEARNTFDPAQRDALLGQLHAYIVQQLPFVFVAHDVGPRAMSPRVHGVVEPHNWLIDIATMSIQ
ncbi:ABC transporter substrate-binding protein [Burkholderia sp. WAC0059]|uniref:ABC transporter substrate-binding protein n=1 Tax=Burkholderia sp. WAC0059 TaxID=2066022 RepID=UPI000C7F4345|nr:ABC transporter substrate-binding protein [Burkholderia sp. WAC0059]PLZ02278.1 ABC transporter substrate-binding protein [Burkholderia sp. WAC0059]